MGLSILLTPGNLGNADLFWWKIIVLLPQKPVISLSNLNALFIGNHTQYDQLKQIKMVPPTLDEYFDIQA
jgi:hypothetical protein